MSLVLRVLLGNPAPHALAAIVDHRLLAARVAGSIAGDFLLGGGSAWANSSTR